MSMTEPSNRTIRTSTASVKSPSVVSETNFVVISRIESGCMKSVIGRPTKSSSEVAPISTIAARLA